MTVLLLLRGFQSLHSCPRVAWPLGPPWWWMGPICVRRDSAVVRNHEKPLREDHLVHETGEEMTEVSREEHGGTIKGSSDLQKYVAPLYCWKHNSDSLWWCHLWDEITETALHLRHLPAALPDGSLILHAAVHNLLPWEVAAQSLRPIGLPHACQRHASQLQGVLLHGAWIRSEWLTKLQQKQEWRPLGMKRADGKKWQEKLWASGCGFASVMGGLLPFRETCLKQFSIGLISCLSVNTTTSAWVLALHIYLVTFPCARAALEQAASQRFHILGHHLKGSCYCT